MMRGPMAAWRTVAFQGKAGNYAHHVCGMVVGQAEAVACETFEAAVQAVEEGHCEGVILPVENSTMGRIADIHALLPKTTLRVVGEAYLPIRHCLLGVKGGRMEDVHTVVSQLPALLQCKETIAAKGWTTEPWGDTAGAAAQVAAWGDTTKAALASAKAAEVYGLEILVPNMSDEAHNTTRFLALGREEWAPPVEVPAKVALMWRVRDLPAALYKSLGGFATNGINLTKIESYLVGGGFAAAEFYAEAEGHMGREDMRRALEELQFFAHDVRILGCFAQGVLETGARGPI